jgi:formate dehydrogenase maturation protein FdhE
MQACPNCRSQDLTRVDMRIGEEQMRFARCRDCEHRWWVGAVGARTIGLTDVLARVAASTGSR